MASIYLQILLLTVAASFHSLLTGSLRLPSSNTLSYDETWSTAVRKGTLLYRQLQSGCFPDIERPITLGQLIKQGWYFTEPGTWPPSLGYSTFFSEFEERTFGWTDGLHYYEQPIRSGNRGTSFLSRLNMNPDMVSRFLGFFCCNVLNCGSNCRHYFAISA